MADHRLLMPPAPRRSAGLSAFVVLVALVTSFTAASQVSLRPGELIQAGGATLDLGDHAIPCAADWNGDGVIDLLVGYRYADKIALFTNSGTPQNPQFGGFAHVQAGGSDIHVAGSGCGAPAPWACDFDSDGKRDLLVGSGSTGRVLFYQNTNSDTAPVLADGVEIMLGGSTLSVGVRATPYVCDWHGDSLADLLCGDGGGNVHFFENTGTAESPRFTTDVLIPADGVTLNIGWRSAVRVCDWNGDGLPDLLGSAGNNAIWCRNTGTLEAPQLSAPVNLQAPVPGTGLTNIDTGYRMRLEVVDWDADQIPDLLIGRHDGMISRYDGYFLSFRGITRDAAGSLVLEWNSASHLEYDVLAGPSPDQIDTVIAPGVASGGDTTTWPVDVTSERQFYQVRQP